MVLVQTTDIDNIYDDMYICGSNEYGIRAVVQKQIPIGTLL